MPVDILYIPAYLRVSKKALKAEIANIDEDDFASIDVLMKVDYVYHHHDNDYDGGLSFIDRLYKKVGQYDWNNWDTNQLKENIRNSNDPQAEYVRVISQMLSDNRNVAIYGL